MTELTLPAPAKLNLFLHITSGPICQGHKPGYHHLETLFQLISLSDVLRFRRSRSRAIGLHCPGLNTPAADNLVTRAAHALQAHTHCTYGADITVNKCLPAGGGLGGGSSDAATTLLALNVLWDLRLNLDTLADIGRTLGADVPVFIRGHTAHATGIGDKLTPCQQPPLWFVLVKPRASIATADVFRHPALPRQTPPFFSDVPPFCAPTSTFWRDTRNDCEAVARQLCPEIGAILDHLTPHATARLTGTGSTCFAVFETQSAAQNAMTIWRAQPELDSCWIQLAHGINRSPVHAALDINID